MEDCLAADGLEDLVLVLDPLIVKELVAKELSHLNQFQLGCDGLALDTSLLDLRYNLITATVSN